MHRIYIDLQLINIFQWAVLFLVTFWVIFFFRDILNKTLPFAANRSRCHRVHLSDVQLLRDMPIPRKTPVCWGVKNRFAPKMGVAQKQKVFEEGNLQRINGDMSTLGSISTSTRLNHVYYYYYYHYYYYHYYYHIIHNYTNICAVMVWTCPGLD